MSTSLHSFVLLLAINLSVFDKARVKSGNSSSSFKENNTTKVILLLATERVEEKIHNSDFLHLKFWRLLINHRL